jgi:hypothetical protein
MIRPPGFAVTLSGAVTACDDVGSVNRVVPKRVALVVDAAVVAVAVVVVVTPLALAMLGRALDATFGETVAPEVSVGVNVPAVVPVVGVVVVVPATVEGATVAADVPVVPLSTTASAPTTGYGPELIDEFTVNSGFAICCPLS